MRFLSSRCFAADIFPFCETEHRRIEWKSHGDRSARTRRLTEEGAVHDEIVHLSNR